MEEIKKWFEEETGLKVIHISRIGLSVYLVEAEDGNTYKIG